MGMNLVNNRYKVEAFLNKENFEDYLVRDSFDNNNLKFMRIIDGEKNRQLTDLYMKEYVALKNIKHKRILNIEAFGIVETINLKRNNLPLYYSITDKPPSPTLDEIYRELSFFERIRIIQELLSTIDYLHFRGFAYKNLNPRSIFYSRESGIKINSITSAIEYDCVQTIDQFNEEFVAPSVLIKKDKNNIKTDYYSLGMIIRYLLMENYTDEKSFIFFGDLNINLDTKGLLKEIITALFGAYKNNAQLSLIHIIDDLNEVAEKRFVNEFKEEREHLYFKTKLIGREHELKYLDGIDRRLENNTLDINGLMIKGMGGVGKTRLIKEITFRLKIKGRDVFKVNVDQALSYDLDILRIFLNIVTHNVEKNILDRYRNNFIKFIPEKYDYDTPYINENSLQRLELYKLFNSICNYLKEISTKNPVYIMIDNIDKYNDIFIRLIDYLLQSLFNAKVFIIFTHNKFEEERTLSYKIKKWIEEKVIEEITLKNLTKKETAILTQNILGMSFPPAEFASVLYDSSKGNPRFLDLSIKEIYNNKELYISDKGRWYSEEDNYADLSLPTDFKKTIIKQTKDITGDKLKVLRLISVSNESLSKFIIYNMLDFDIKYLNDIINSLLNEQILVENSYDSSYYYGFLSNELKATVYFEIDNEEKRLLHSRLAELLIEYKPNIIRDLVDEIAFHLIRAGERKKAIDLVVSEANKFENIYIDKSISLWEMAFSIVKDVDHEKKIDILERLTKINLHKSNVENLQVYLDEFSKEAVKLNRIEYRMQAKKYYAELYLRNNDMEQLEMVIKEMDRLSSENDYIEGKILCYTLSVVPLIKDSNADRLFIKNKLEEALALSKSNHITAHLGKIYFQYGLFFDINGEPYESLKYYEKSIEHLEKNGDIYETIKAINNIGNVCLERIGDKERCFEYFEQGLEIANRYGFTHLESIFLHNIGEAYLNILEYNKAMEYTKKAMVLAQGNKDMSMIIVSNCNIGRIHLMTSAYDQAYKTYNLIKDMDIKEMITDTEIMIAYRNFLAEFYFNFGQYDRSIEYSNLIIEMTQGFSLNYYFKSIIRLIHIDYIQGTGSKDKIYQVLETYKKENIREVYIWNVFILVLIALNKCDFEFANALMAYYHGMGKSENPELIKDIASILEIYLTGEKAKLRIVEEKLNEIESRKNYNVDLRLYIYLANMYKEMAECEKSMRYNIKAFDGIYKAVDSIEEDDLKRSFVKNLEGQRLKDNINQLLDQYYGMNIRSIDFDDVDETNFHQYFDLTPIIDSLTNKEINEIVSYQYDIGIADVCELLSRLDDNYLNNINLILQYLGKETLAQRGFVLKYNDDKVNLDPLVSLVENDTKLPNEMILHQSLRRKGGFLYNFNCKGRSQNKYATYTPKEARGVICIPITSKKTHTSLSMVNYYDMDENNVHGYIYLQTDNALNRFDMERRKLIFSLSKLISLNLENENLRINATMDKLTAVYTRKYFELKFELILEGYRKKQGNLSLFMLDIDRFKGFNDKYGHLKGDEVLSQVTHTIKTTVSTNGMVGRYGGEEFIILLWDCDLNEAIKIGEEIRKNVERMHIPGIDDTVTVSIGLTQFPVHSSYKMELIDNADQALFYAKEVLSRNTLVVWHRDMEGSNKSTDKTRGLITGNPAESKRNVLQLMDITESIKEDQDIEDKIYQLLGSIITVSNCEYTTFLQYKDRQVIKNYTRKREVIEWLEDSHIHLNLVDQVYEKKKGICTIDWHDEFKDDFHIPDWDSVLVVPVVKKEIVEGVLYITVPLKEKEFNQETLNAINVFANIFSGNF